MFMAKFKSIWVLVVLTFFSSAALLQSEGPAVAHDNQGPQFQGKDTLLRPVGYREWVFVGSSFGLRYSPDPEAKQSGKPEIYHNVYINPPAYREFSRTGKFPDGTMMVLELASAEVKREPGLQGSYQKQYVGLEASVRDSKHFEKGWAYFSFDGPDGKRKDTAQPFPPETCWSCHHEKAATDHVFTQFYPVLRATRNAE